MVMSKLQIFAQVTVLAFLLLERPASAGCTNVPASVEAGTIWGSVEAGVVYRFTATGTSSYDCPGGLYVDADGLPYGAGVTDTNLHCSTLKPLALVGRVGATCIQL